MIYEVGEEVPLRYLAINSDGDLVTATVVLTVTKPDGTEITPAVTQTSTGVFDAAVDVVAASTWQYRWVVSGPFDDVESGTFVVANVAPKTYVDLEIVRQAAGLTHRDEDALLAMHLRSACRRLDKRCGRRFLVPYAETVREYSFNARIIPANDYDGEGFIVSDIASLAGLVVEVGDGTTWTTVPASAYFGAPDNAIADGKPVTVLRLRSRGMTWASFGGNRLRVTARHGWPAIPDEIESASLLLTVRLHKRKDSPEGVMGSAEWGTVRVSRLDPDVEELIKDLILLPGGFA